LLRYVRISKVLVVIAFYPLYLSLLVGPVIQLVLFGFAMFLYLRAAFPHTRKIRYAEGFALSISCIKPHLLFLVYFHLFCLSFRTREWRTIIGFLGGIIVLSLAPVLINENIYWYYLEVFSRLPVNWENPTIGSWLQVWLSDFRGIYQIVPAVAAMLLLTGLHCKARNTTSLISEGFLLAIVAPLSVISTPYLWGYDFAVLIPSLMWCFHELASQCRTPSPSRIIVVVLALALVLSTALLWLNATQAQYCVWYPIVIFSVSLMLWNISNRQLRADLSSPTEGAR